MARFRIVHLLVGLSLAGCAAAAPGTSVSKVQASGQQCAVCVIENPGDVSPCEGICQEHEADQAGAWAGAVLR